MLSLGLRLQQPLAFWLWLSHACLSLLVFTQSFVLSGPGYALQPFMWKFSSFFFSLSLVIPQFELLSHISFPQIVLRSFRPSLSLPSEPNMQSMLPCPASAHRWQTPGLLVCWQLLLGTYSVGFFFFPPPSYVALWDSKTPHRPAGERVSWCLETSPLLRLPPRDGSVPLILLCLFISFIFCPTSFGRQWAAFLGVWYPLPEFRSCFVEFTQHLNVLLMNLWGRKWSPHPIPLPS